MKKFTYIKECGNGEVMSENVEAANFDEALAKAKDECSIYDHKLLSVIDGQIIEIWTA